MRLLRLKVEQLRRFRQPVEIRDLDAGINLFTGPNESGKSTLVRAIRAAFFERYKSSSVEDLDPEQIRRALGLRVEELVDDVASPDDSSQDEEDAA